MKKLKRIIKRTFVSDDDRIMLGLIVINMIAVFLEECNIENVIISFIDVACTILFAIEMLVKIHHFGWKGYWSKNWNRLDGILVLVSLPSLIILFVPDGMFFDLSVMLVLRVLRVFRVLRLMHFYTLFPHFEQISRNFWKAIKDSTPIFFCFVLLVLICSLFTCFFFKDVSPEYFGSPIDSIYTTFRLCTIEGWYEIPDSISMASSPWMGYFVKLYFIGIVIMGGIIGISLVNSVFVDAMVSDNNDSLEKKVTDLQEQLDRIEKLLNEKNGSPTSVKTDE